METIKEMRQRQKKEIEALQSQCPHQDVSDWQVNYYHGNRQYEVRVCKTCGKVIERRDFPLRPGDELIEGPGPLPDREFDT